MSTATLDQLESSQMTLSLWLERAQWTGRRDHYLGKRRSPRYQWRTDVQVEVRNPNGSIEYVYAKTKDISETGLGLIFRRPVEPRAQIRVQLEDETEAGVVSGTIAHCTQTVGTYIVGIDCEHAATA